MRITAVIAMLFIAMDGPTHAQEVVRIGTEAGYPPFEYRDATGTLKGFDVDIGNALCAEMQVRCVWVTQDFDGLIPALKAHKIDVVIASLSVTAERAKAVDFTEAYYKSPSQLVSLKTAGLSADAATLKGKVIGVESGTIHQTYVEQKLPGAREKTYDTLLNADLDLEAGRLDAILADKLAMYDWLKKEGAAKGFDYAGGPIDDPLLSGDVAIAVVKGNTALKDRLNISLSHILSDGEFDRINGNYFPFSIRPD